MKKITSILAAAALTAGTLIAAPALVSSPVASSQAFTCVHFGNYNGGYSLADGCSASLYFEKMANRWFPANYAPRSYRSTFGHPRSGYQGSMYLQYI